MDNVFTLEACQRGSGRLGSLRIKESNRVAHSNIYIKAMSLNDVGRDPNVGNAGNIKRIDCLLWLWHDQEDWNPCGDVLFRQSRDQQT